jgi:Pyruvate/2-oxoacid:ferredoxin oxidoreductase delta subunit
MTSDARLLVTSFGMPDFLEPWTGRFFEPLDLEVVRTVACAEGSAGTERPAVTERPAGAARAVATASELLARVPGLTPAGLERLMRRGIVNLEGHDGDGAVAATTVALADFHTRFEIWAMFEGWKDVPEEIADLLNDWELEHYVRGHGEGDEVTARDPHQAYLLLAEAEDIVRSTQHVYQWPCDCRAMFRRCRKPVNVCLRFDNARGLGWEISGEKAIEILRETDRAGLMHTGYPLGGPEEPGAICNCCTDCCFPHLATERLGTGDVWPVRRHAAVVDAGACTLCRRCAKRCPFGALALGDGEAVPAGAVVAARRCGGKSGAADKGRSLLFFAGLCRGCGLCATDCPEHAIAMEPLEGSTA